MIIVVEGPSAAGKTTWCETHAPGFLPEPGRWPIERVMSYQVERWRRAIAADARGEVVVLDGDPFKLYFAWANRHVGHLSEDEWNTAVDRARRDFAAGDCGFADLVLYSDPGEGELRRRREGDRSRTRRNFERNTSLREHFREWYEVVAELDPSRVEWSHPESGITASHLQLGRRRARSSLERFDTLVARLPRVR